MAGRSRHGLHVVEEGRPPGAPSRVRFTEDGGKRPFLSLHQQSVVLRIGGLLNADTAGRLRLFLSMSTVDGGPAEVVLDLAAVHAVDEDGMAPIHVADESMASGGRPCAWHPCRRRSPTTSATHAPGHSRPARLRIRPGPTRSPGRWSRPWTTVLRALVRDRSDR